MTQPANAKPNVRELIDWSLIRSIMAQGASIQQDYVAGNHPTYEHYSARLDEAARERYEALRRHIEQMEAAAIRYERESILSALGEHPDSDIDIVERISEIRAEARQSADLRRDWERECSDADQCLEPLGIEIRTEGGSLHVPRIKNMLVQLKREKEELQARKWPDDLEAGFTYAMQVAKLAGASDEVLAEMARKWRDESETPNDPHAECFHCGAMQPHFAALRADAERLDHVVRRIPGNVARDLFGVLSNTGDLREWRAAIDAALAQERK